MDGLLAFWLKHVPHAPRELLGAYGTVSYWPKGGVIKMPDIPFPYFCVVLDGLVGGYQLSRGGRITLRELTLPLDFFTGTEHLFTQRDRGMEYRALLATRLLRIPVETARAGQQEYPAIAELFHVMKQRKINTLRNLATLYREADSYHRYREYRSLLPDYALALPHFVQQELLGMSETTYYRVKRKFLKGPKH